MIIDTHHSPSFHQANHGSDNKGETAHLLVSLTCTYAHRNHQTTCQCFMKKSFRAMMQNKFLFKVFCQHKINEPRLNRGFIMVII